MLVMIIFFVLAFVLARFLMSMIWKHEEGILHYAKELASHAFIVPVYMVFLEPSHFHLSFGIESFVFGTVLLFILRMIEKFKKKRENLEKSKN